VIAKLAIHWIISPIAAAIAPWKYVRIGAQDIAAAQSPWALQGNSLMLAWLLLWLLLLP